MCYTLFTEEKEVKRMAKNKRNQTYSFDEDTIKKLSDIAEKMGWSKSDTVANLVDMVVIQSVGDEPASGMQVPNESETYSLALTNWEPYMDAQKQYKYKELVKAEYKRELNRFLNGLNNDTQQNIENSFRQAGYVGVWSQILANGYQVDFGGQDCKVIPEIDGYQAGVPVLVTEGGFNNQYRVIYSAE